MSCPECLKMKNKLALSEKQVDILTEKVINLQNAADIYARTVMGIAATWFPPEETYSKEGADEVV